MGFLKRSAMTVAAIGAAGAIVAGGTIPTLATTTSGVRYQAVQYVTQAGGPNGVCYATVLSAAVSAGNPAYVSAMVANTTTEGCTGWLQSSVNGGAWKDVSPKQSVPGGPGLTFSNEPWYKTANYYAGPGTRIRACVQVPLRGVPPRCSGPVSLAASSAKPASDGTSVYYTGHQGVTISSGGPYCAASLNSTTKSKTSTSQVSMVLLGVAVEPTCTTGWLESSTDNGKTWTQATPTYSLKPVSGIEYAFSSAVADGTGHLVRACVMGNAAKKCSAAW